MFFAREVRGMDRIRLRQLLISHVSLEEFKDLCFELGGYGVLYDALPGDGLGAKARELILLCERGGFIPALLDACRRLRPNVAWDEEPLPAPPPASTPPPVIAPAVTPAGPSPALPPPDPLDAHFTQLIRGLIDGRVVPFLGADINLCGRPTDAQWSAGQYLPSAVEIGAYLGQQLQASGIPLPDDDDLISLAQYTLLKIGESSLYDYLRGFYNADYPPNPAHQLLAWIPGLLRERGYRPRYPIIVTTAFDDVLERAFQARGEPYDLMIYLSSAQIRGKFIHVPHGGAPQIIDKPNEYDLLPLDQRVIIAKIYGAIDRLDPERDSYVITEDDYIGYMSKSDITNVVPATLVSRVRKSHFLFLGYDLCDWNNRVVLQRLWDDDKLLNRSWAVPLDRRALDEEFWRRRDVDLIRQVDLQTYIARLTARLAALPPAGGAA